QFFQKCYCISIHFSLSCCATIALIWSSMRLGLAYNQRPDALAAESKSSLSNSTDPTGTDDAYVEWDEPTTIAAVADALRAFGEVVLLEAVSDFASRLQDAQPDLLFNMAEGHKGPCREAHVPAIAEFLGIRYTG